MHYCMKMEKRLISYLALQYFSVLGDIKKKQENNIDELCYFFAQMIILKVLTSKKT